MLLIYAVTNSEKVFALSLIHIFDLLIDDIDNTIAAVLSA